MRRFLPKRKGAVVLDAGGGTGYWAIRLARHGYRVVLTDISETMLKVANGKIEKQDLQELIETRVVDIRDMSCFPSNLFDMALAEGDPVSYCLHAEKAVRELARVIKPNAYVVVSVDSKYSMIPRLIPGVNPMSSFGRSSEFLRTGFFEGECKLQALGSDNVISIYHHGSRVRGEARSDSNYDTILVLREIDEKILQKLREVLSKYRLFQTYLLSTQDFEDLPPGQRLQFFEGQKLYGDQDLRLPSADQVLEEIKRSRLESLHYLRHYLTLPHDKERKARLVHFQLKDAYFCLKRIAYYVTGDLVSTRKELISRLVELPVNHSLARELLQTLEYYEERKPEIAEDPDGYLLKLEKFFRVTCI